MFDREPNALKGARSVRRGEQPGPARDLALLPYSSHKVSGVARAIAARGAHLLFLPAYSPDLNPIEMAFSKLKAYMRKVAQRDFKGLMKATADALDTFSAEHCAGFLRHANYATN